MGAAAPTPSAPTGGVGIRRRFSRAYARRAYALYRPHHVAHGIAMTLKAVGLPAKGRFARAVGRIAWQAMRWRAARLASATG